MTLLYWWQIVYFLLRGDMFHDTPGGIKTERGIVCIVIRALERAHL